jgi:drug/metabolite transporter, DME family
VFGEHVVLVVLTLPFAFGAVAAVLRLGWRHVLAAVAIGAGASAVATILFTEALFAHHDFVTPVVLQKVQPVFAVLGAVVVLGERPRGRFAAYFVLALAGTWLMGVPRPFHPEAHGLVTMLYALGAALLWGLGTVFGRYLARDMRFEHVTTLRFVFGLPASAIALLVLGVPAFASWHDTFWIAVLALVTGLAAMLLYYYGLRSTPAVAATIAELAYPVTAILVGYFKFGQTLTGWQWVGVALTSTIVALLPTRSRDTLESLPSPAPAPA